MTNYITSESKNIFNTTLLKVNSGEVDYTREKEMEEVSERFLHSAALLPENEVIGLQLSWDVDGVTMGYAFSSYGSNVTDEDYEWIFKGFGTIDNSRSSKAGNLPGESGNVYVLSYIAGSTMDTSGLQKKNSYYEDVDYTGSCRYFKDMLKMLMEQKAVIRIIAGAADSDLLGHGMILISFPGEMTLRMRTIISLAFPHLAAEEAGTLRKEKHMPDDLLLDGMSRFLIEMTRRESVGEFEHKSEDSIMEDEFEDMRHYYEDDEEECRKENNNKYTPIESLELSARAYNCLRRAGVYSVEKLLTMTDEELKQVRNLGYKSLSEIKGKIVEINESKKMVLFKEESYIEMLNDLIGLEGVKEQVRRIAAFAKMKKDMVAKGNDKLSVALNMEFVGNPGTAKTTVARIVAGIFNEIGMLPADGLIEVGRADLVARYEGQTASKVQEVFRKAKGKVLFIDEAYSLVENCEGQFGDEAINTIVQEMENNREDTVVIFAGYPDKMEGFFSRNPGLRSRVPFCISFKDYSAADMLKIAEREAQNRGFTIDERTKEKVLSICETVAGKPESGNGRFSRNLVEDAILSYAARVYGELDEADGGDFTLLDEDFRIPENHNQARNVIPMGFHA